MATEVRYGLARSYQLSGALTATVSDAGGAARAVTIAASGSWVRPVIALTSGTGASTSDPYELFTTATTALNAGAGGGTWAIVLSADGRTQVTWTGAGTGAITAGGLLAALGFASGVGPLTSGSSSYSPYPPLGLLTWPYSIDSTGWVPEIDSARTTNGAGQLVVYRSSAIRQRLRFVATWVPRTYGDNASGEHFSPAWSLDVLSSGPTSVSAPDYNATATPGGWMDFIYGMSGEIECGYSENVVGYLDGGYALGVSLGASMFDPNVSLPTSSPTLNTRRDVAVELLRRRDISS
jgi:hypothetical protein